MTYSTGWREKARQALHWAELIAGAGVIAAAFSGAFGADPVVKTTISVILPVVVVALRVAKVF